MCRRASRAKRRARLEWRTIMTNIGIIVFDGAEELDFVGPWEVFGAALQSEMKGSLVTVAETARPIRSAKGLSVVPDTTFSQAPRFDVILVPGGQGTRREVNNAVMIDYLRKAGAGAKWVTSVCTGALLLHEAGF